MAIKIECTQCGFRNDLGRVFCTKCGVKLDLRRTAQSDLQERRELEIVPILGRIAGILLVVVPVALLALAFWPAKPPAVLLDSAGTQQVQMKTRAVKQALMARQKVGVEFSEGELNGYLANRASLRGFKKLTVDVTPGQFELMASLAWRPAAVSNVAWVVKNRVAAPITLTMKAGFTQGRLSVRGVKVGHLPLPGPAKSLVTGFFADLFKDVIAEKQVVESVSDAVFGQDKVSFKFGR